MSKAAVACRVATVFGGTCSSARPATTCTLMPPARRISEWVSEPCSSSRQRGRLGLPMTMWVTLLASA